MTCPGCAPHVPHYGRCFNWDRCECKVEEPPLPYLGFFHADTDDYHEEQIVYGDKQDWLSRALESYEPRN